MGEFAGLKSVSTACEDFVSLFQEILIDLPVGEYFRKFIDSIIEVLRAAEGKDGGEKGGIISAERVSEMIDDYSSSDIKVFLRKIWLVKFHRWGVANSNGATQEYMDDLLKAESDWETL